MTTDEPLSFENFIKDILFVNKTEDEKKDLYEKIMSELIMKIDVNDLDFLDMPPQYQKQLILQRAAIRIKNNPVANPKAIAKLIIPPF